MALSSPKRWTNDACERTRSVTCPASTWQLKWDATANLDEEGGGHEVDDTWMQACHSRLKSWRECHAVGTEASTVQVGAERATSKLRKGCSPKTNVASGHPEDDMRLMSNEVGFK